VLVVELVLILEYLVVLVVAAEVIRMVELNLEGMEVKRREPQLRHQHKVILAEQVNMLLAPGKVAAVAVALVALVVMLHQVLVQLDMVEQVFKLLLLDQRLTRLVLVV
jgi:hypothetical protein